MNYRNKILIIPDTNFLYTSFDKKADFRQFTFGQPFLELVDTIEKHTLYEKISIGISEVVLEELLAQRIEAFSEQLDKLKYSITKYSFPNVDIDEEQIKPFDYVEYITRVRSDYIRQLKSKLITFIDLPIPSQIRFRSIIKRAFEKRPPFEGVKGKSDKGFKDALFWESVLDLNLDNEYENIIVVTSDERLNNAELIHEFRCDHCSNYIEIVRPEVLGAIISSFEIEKKDKDFVIDTKQNIAAFLEQDPTWMNDIRLGDLFPEMEYVEITIVNHEVKDFELVENDFYNVNIELRIDIIDIHKAQIRKIIPILVVLRLHDNAWFFIEYSLRG